MAEFSCPPRRLAIAQRPCLQTELHHLNREHLFAGLDQDAVGREIPRGWIKTQKPGTVLRKLGWVTGPLLPCPLVSCLFLTFSPTLACGRLAPRAQPRREDASSGADGLGEDT